MKIIFSANSFYHIYKLRLDIINHLRNDGNEIIILGKKDNFESQINDLGFQTYSVKIKPNKKNIFHDIYVTFQYLNLYLKIKPDIIFHSTIKPNIYGSIASRILRIRTINNISGLGTIFFKNNFLTKIVKFLYRISQKKAEKILFQNNDDLEFFVKNNLCKKNKAIRIPGSGVNTQLFKKSNELTNNKKYFSFAYIGRPVKEKGIVEYIDSAKLFINLFPKTEFRIIGGFDQNNPAEISKKYIQKKIEGYPSIKIEGYKDNIKQILSEIDCLVLPSYREGMSNVIMEACSMETTVIASNVPGCNELITNGENGFLFKERNVKSTLKAMKKIYNLSEKERLHMGNNGREKMVKHFDIKIIKKIYDNIILNS